VVRSSRMLRALVRFICDQVIKQTPYETLSFA